MRAEPGNPSQHAARSGPPSAAAGYSATPLYRKLGVTPEARVLVVGAPTDVDVAQLAPPALGVDLVAVADIEPGVDVEPGPDADPGVDGHPGVDADPGVLGAFQVLLLFCPDAARLHELLLPGMAATAQGGRCWVAWPKRASGMATDLTEDVVRDAALAEGWVDVKVAAVDRIWSGLCLMRRRRNGSSRSGG